MRVSCNEHPANLPAFLLTCLSSCQLACCKPPLAPPAPQPDDYEAVMFKRPLLAGVRSLLPSWLGGPRKKQAS